MESVVIIIMILVCFNYLLKQTFWNNLAVGIGTVILVLFILFTWEYSIEQSRTQIADWLSDTALMRDVSVIITFDVIVQMSYTLLAIHVYNDYPVERRTIYVYRILKFFPTVLIFPTIFSVLTALIFLFPGTEFSTIAYVFAAIVAVFVPITSKYVILSVLPEKELRLELLFVTNALIMILGVVATVNGRTSAIGSNTIDLYSLLGTIGIAVVFIGFGIVQFYLLRYIKQVRRQARNQKQ